MNREKLLLAHLDRLTELLNFALDNCLIENDAIISVLDKELDTVKSITNP